MCLQRCIPAFHRPASIGKNGIVFYVVYWPEQYIGIYLQWYQLTAIFRIVGKKNVDFQGFATPEAALASFSEVCSLAHEHRHPPLPPADPFTMSAFHDFRIRIGPDCVYKGPPPSGLSGAVPLHAQEPSSLPSPAPSPRARTTPLPSTFSSTVSSTRTVPDADSYRTAASDPQPVVAASTRHTAAAASSYRTAATSPSSPTYHTARLHEQGGSSRTKPSASAGDAPSVGRAKTRSHGGKMPASRSRAASSTTSMDDVASWIETTTSAMAELEVASVGTVSSISSGALTAAFPQRTYVVVADNNFVLQIFERMSEAKEFAEEARAGNYPDAHVVFALNPHALKRLLDKYNYYSLANVSLD
ncbi:hypothetical protein EV121DRAFT_297179 [Schizophyllum commune]